jgi:hypothetical protein
MSILNEFFNICYIKQKLKTLNASSMFGVRKVPVPGGTWATMGQPQRWTTASNSALFASLVNGESASRSANDSAEMVE